jgi:hypothetical protein
MAQDQGNWWAAGRMVIDPQAPLNVETLTSLSKRPLLHGVRHRLHHTFKLLYSHWVLNFTTYHGQDEL